MGRKLFPAACIGEQKFGSRQGLDFDLVVDSPRQAGLDLPYDGSGAGREVAPLEENVVVVIDRWVGDGAAHHPGLARWKEGDSAACCDHDGELGRDGIPSTKRGRKPAQSQASRTKSKSHCASHLAGTSPPHPQDRISRTRQSKL